MKESLMEYIVCPMTGSELKLEVFKKEGKDIVEGLLTSKEKRTYPIIDGVPRLLPEDLLDELVYSNNPEFVKTHKKELYASKSKSKFTGKLKKNTSKSFGFEWNVFSKMFPEYEENFLEYIRPLEKDFFKGKVVLDAGCGVGRHTYYAAKWKSKAAIGMDLSDAVTAAHNNCRQFDNCHIVQADIYHPPFRKDFDYVFSIGVLHHLPQPEEAFRTLKGFLRKKGMLSIWVYGFEGNWFARHVYEPIRGVSTMIPHRTLYTLCHLPASIMQIANWVSKFFNAIGLGLIARLIPFSYYARFPYEVKLNDSFDVFATPKSRYYRMDEIRRWFKRAGLKDVKLLFLRKRSIKGFGIA